jgi:uncharacterized protein
MSLRDSYPTGVPCWVERLSPDIETAKRFYAGIFGWEFAGPGAMPTDPPGQYFVAKLRDREVAGIGTLPAGAADAGSAWSTHVAVASVDDVAATAQAADGQVLVEPFDVPPAGRLAVLSDPSGAAFCVWQAGQREGAQLVNEPSAWAMSMLGTDDPDSAQAFYGELFGWRASSFDAGPGADVWVWQLPGYVGGEPGQPVPRDVVAVMMRMPAGESAPPPSWSVDFWIGDADAAAAHAPELGGAVIAPPHEMAGFTRTILADPHGAVFSASQLLQAH